MTSTPEHTAEYDGRHRDLVALDAILDAWTEGGKLPRWHTKMKTDVRRMIPALGRALDRAAADRAAQRSGDAIAALPDDADPVQGQQLNYLRAVARRIGEREPEGDYWQEQLDRAQQDYQRRNG